jgi:dGTPase
VTIAQLDEIDFYARHRAAAEAEFPGISGRRAINETVRRMINTLIVDLINASKVQIADAQLKTVDDVRNASPLITFSDDVAKEAVLLKRFLRENLYQHFQVNRMTSKARRIVTELFHVFMREPNLLGPDYQVRHHQEGANLPIQARKVADYIAGMTDRYAIREHRRLFAVDEI